MLFTKFKNSTLFLVLIDVASVIFSLYLSFLLRFEFKIPPFFYEKLLFWIPFFIFFHVSTFSITSMYGRMWRYTSLFDLYAIIGSVLTSIFLSYSFILLTSGVSGYPRSVLILYPVFLGVLSLLSRLSVRVYYSHYHSESKLNVKNNMKKVILIGAGKTGEKIAREILSSPKVKYQLMGFVDDNMEKQGSRLHGKKIFCGVEGLLNLKVVYQEIIITAPSADGNQLRRILKICKKTGKRYKIVPSMNEILKEENNLAAIRDVSYADLLGREEVKLDMNSIDKLLFGKRVLITGAGGSIGSELVKQCLPFKPAEIVCIDNGEEKIYNLEQNFVTYDKALTMIKTVLASVNSIKEIEKVFIENRPQIVFHAAAYKHVPIQELHPWTAVKTNFGGTLNLVTLSDKYSVDKFVLVSTDKAVNPVNVMGATKRISEKLIQSFNNESKTNFMAVRFGNVLGSSGSVVPAFQRQINKGEPLTITHPEMTRYFMSIQEASQLILQCGAFGKDGEIFLLEMGRPVKILQMAKDLIRISGLEPEIDIPIIFTGLRPGEKLYEELQFKNESKVGTNHKKIMILEKSNLPMPW